MFVAPVLFLANLSLYSARQSFEIHISFLLRESLRNSLTQFSSLERLYINSKSNPVILYPVIICGFSLLMIFVNVNNTSFSLERSNTITLFSCTHNKYLSGILQPPLTIIIRLYGLVSV